MQSILRHVDFNVVKCVILASPGFVKDQCFEYMIQMAIKTDNKLLLDNRGKFLLVKASSGFKHSLKGKENCYLCLFVLAIQVRIKTLKTKNYGLVISVSVLGSSSPFVVAFYGVSP